MDAENANATSETESRVEDVENPTSSADGDAETVVAEPVVAETPTTKRRRWVLPVAVAVAVALGGGGFYGWHVYRAHQLASQQPQSFADMFGTPPVPKATAKPTVSPAGFSGLVPTASTAIAVAPSTVVKPAMPTIAPTVSPPVAVVVPPAKVVAVVPRVKPVEVASVDPPHPHHAVKVVHQPTHPKPAVDAAAQANIAKLHAWFKQLNSKANNQH